MTSIPRSVRAAKATALSAGAVFSSLIAAPLSPAAGCNDVEVVFARGTKEAPGIGRVGEAFVNDLISTLKDASEVAKAYREDVQILKQIAQTAVPDFGNEPQSIIPKQPQEPATMPGPYWGRFAVKPDEPEAPLESVRDVDLTPSESDIIEQERQESAGDFEAQERMKAATREADQARLKELADLSGESQ